MIIKFSNILALRKIFPQIHSEKINVTRIN